MAWRVEDVVGDAADAAAERKNILLDAREQSMKQDRGVRED